MQNREKYYLTLCLFLTIHIACGQKLSLIKSFDFPSIHIVSIDVNSSFYVADQQGNIFKFDSTGRELNVYSPQRPSEITLLDASKTMNIFVFSRDLQQFRILNRFLSSPSYTEIDRDYIGYAYMAGPSLDNNLWIFDNSAFSLKKYDITLQNVTIEAPLDLILDTEAYNITQITEYQNKVYLNNVQSGILVFDNLGNHGAALPFKTNYFNFLNDEIYFIEEGELIFYNLYSRETRKISSGEIEKAKYALAFNRKVLLFTEERISIFQLH
ncbi:MAG TPA: hypothetical protein VD908_19105 [Cytophagales bacterium]|nr:hypothetical protein [Cytophagales bacterium]